MPSPFPGTYGQSGINALTAGGPPSARLAEVENTVNNPVPLVHSQLKNNKERGGPAAFLFFYIFTLHTDTGNCGSTEYTE